MKGYPNNVDTGPLLSNTLTRPCWSLVRSSTDKLDGCRLLVEPEPKFRFVAGASHDLPNVHGAKR